MADPQLMPDDAAVVLSSTSEEDTARDLAGRYGLEFVDVDDEKRGRIERFVERLRQELPDAGSRAPK